MDTGCLLFPLVIIREIQVVSIQYHFFMHGDSGIEDIHINTLEFFKGSSPLKMIRRESYPTYNPLKNDLCEISDHNDIIVRYIYIMIILTDDAGLQQRVRPKYLPRVQCIKP